MIKRLVLILFLFVNVGCAEMDKEKLSKSGKIAVEIRYKAAEKILKKHNLKVVGISAAMPGGIINNLGLDFQINQVLSREEAREILVDSVETLLSEINSNEEIRPYLKKFPFTPKNITIDIYIYDSKGKNVYDPNFEVVSASNGKLWYATKSKKKKYGYKSEYEESFEEAIRLVQEAKKKPTQQ